MTDDLDFTEAEISRLKQMAKDAERKEWFWGWIRKRTGYMAAFAAAGVAFRDDAVELIAWFMR